MTVDFEALAVEHERQAERAGRMRAEADCCGCTVKCTLTEFALMSHGRIRLLHAVGHIYSYYEYEPTVMRHWAEKTLLPVEVLKWLRSLHPVCDTVSSVDEPDVWALMRGEA